MKSSQVTIQTSVSDEMYNCIENPLSAVSVSSPQHHNLNNGNKNTNSNHLSSSPSSQSPSDPPSSQSPSENGSQIHLNGSGGNGSSNGYSDRKIQGFEITQHSASWDENDNSSLASSRSTQQGPSNENLLGTAFCTFMGFALVQTVVAVFAGSEAMLGDSAAMIVDALTYLFNWYAEHKKASYETREYWIDAAPMMQASYQNEETRRRVLARIKRKKVLQLELIPPLLSVSTLVVVTGFVLNQAIRVLILDVHRSVSLQGNPNIHIMMYFSIANLGLDLVNVANFAKAKHLFGYDTAEEGPPQGHEALSTDGDNDDDDGRDKTKRAHSHDDSEDADEDQDHKANLNMCSAYTHVFADTLRSIAVLVAACLSELIEEITPEEADASAAVMVSALILLSLIPLLNGLVQSYNELRLIKAEEKNDELLFA